MFHKDQDTLGLLGKYSKKKEPIKTYPKEEKIIYRNIGSFNIKPKTKENSILKIMVIIMVFIGIIITIGKINIESEKNPIIGIWSEQNRRVQNSYIIEFTKDKIIKQGMSYKVKYEIYKDKVDVKMQIGMIESPVGEVYYIHDKNTIIEPTIFGNRMLKRIK